MPVDPGITILVVDDFDALRHLVRAWLREAAFNVLDAAGGEAALASASLHQGPIHLLLTDIEMPGMSGLELARRFRRPRPQTLVLLMSAGWNCAPAPDTPLLQKPFGRATLLSAVATALAGCVVNAPPHAARTTQAVPADEPRKPKERTDIAAASARNHDLPGY
jgi:two-component system cell cycle sensor histidine kinase/response regulator CckA